MFMSDIGLISTETLSLISVLYVDDEPDLLKIGKTFLEQLSEFTVTTITSANEALNSPLLYTYDAIVSDYQMPGMDGIEFLLEVRNNFGDVPFILFTGKGREEIVIQAINGGADFYLQKGGEPQAQFAELAHKNKQAVKRKQAEQQVRESEKRLTDILGFLPDPTFAMDTYGKIIAWNRAVEEMTGIAAGEILGKSSEGFRSAFHINPHPLLIDLIDESDEKIAEFFSHIQRGENSLTAETVMVHSPGYPISVLVKVSRFYNEAGEVTGAIESIRDITDLKKAGEELQRSEERYRSVVNDQTEMIARFTPDGIITFTNNAYLQYFSPILELETITGKNIREIMEIANYDVVERFLSSLTPDHPTRDMERQVTDGNGDPCWQLWTVRALFDDMGQRTEFQVVGRDITERKRSEEALHVAYEKIAADEEELREKYDELARSGEQLRESEEKFKTLFDMAPYGCIVIGPKGTYILVNKNVERITGYSLSDFLGKRSDEIGLIAPGEQIRFTEKMKNQGYLEEEIRITTREGNARTLIVSATLVMLQGERHILATLIDITERRKMESDLVRKQDELQAAYEQLAGSEEELRQQYIEIVSAQDEIRNQERKYRQLFEENFAGMVLMEIVCDDSGDPIDFRYLDANPAYEKITGKDPATIKGKTARDLYERIDREWILKFSEIAFTGRSIHFEYHYPEKNEYFDAITYSPERGQIVILFLDITQRKLAENAIRETNAYLENLISNAFGPIMVWDPDFIISRINRSCELLLGRPADSIIGSTLADLIHPGHTEPLLQLLQRSRETRNQDTIELEMMQPDGSHRTIVWNVSTIMEPGEDKPVATIAQGWDVTTERLLEKERMVAIEKINENMVKLAVLNDGIRNPLSIMACLIDQIDESDVKTRIGKEIERIDQMVINLDKEWMSSEKILNYLRKHYPVL